METKYLGKLKKAQLAITSALGEPIAEFVKGGKVVLAYDLRSY